MTFTTRLPWHLHDRIAKTRRFDPIKLPLRSPQPIVELIDGNGEPAYGFAPGEGDRPSAAIPQ